MGLANRVVPDGQSRHQAEELAREIARFPQTCARHDRLSAYEQAGLDAKVALHSEHAHGMTVLQSGETLDGAKRFAGGAGRHGSFELEGDDE